MGAWPFLCVRERPPLSMREPGRYRSAIFAIAGGLDGAFNDSRSRRCRRSHRVLSSEPKELRTQTVFATFSGVAALRPMGLIFPKNKRLGRGYLDRGGTRPPKLPERHSRTETSSHRGPGSSSEAKTVAARRGPACDVPPRPTKPFSTALKSSRSSGALTTRHRRFSSASRCHSTSSSRL